MCILSGCDYLESLPGIGLGKAKKLLKTVKKSDIDHVRLIFVYINIAIQKIQINTKSTKLNLKIT